ncbi:DUF4118 domain-containing protein [Pelistega indica]|uniref:DUF4118 domain-containing protein n=2 Tax=Pelistega TaxID=106146 RepID=UPI0004092C69|nr:DUF4118 domain-containing protein [Pelistega indica]
MAEELGATTQIINANTIAEGLVSYAHQFNISRIVIGQQRPKIMSFGSSLVNQLSNQDAKLDLILVNQVAENDKPISQEVRSESSNNGSNYWSKDNLYGYLMAFLGCIVVISLATITHWLDLANVLMLYLLVIVFVSVKFGRLPGIFAVFISVLSFDFFFVEPKFSFSVRDVQYLLTFSVLIIVSLLINNLAVNLRFQVHSARYREQQAKSISQLAQGLSASRKTDQIASHATAWLLQYLAQNVLIITPNHQGRLKIANNTQASLEFDWIVAQWVYDNKQKAGVGTHTLAANKMQYRPLIASGNVLGVLALYPKDLTSFNAPEQQRFLDVAVAQIALALERIFFAKIAQEAVVKAESEQLRSTLLSALSHDIRTPLTVLTTLADSLLKVTDQQQQYQLVKDIQQQSRAIQRLVVNILDYAVLQSGGVTVNQQWISLEELIGGLLHQLEFALDNRHVSVKIPEELQFVYTDELLLARILNNLLNNAINYSPPHSPIYIEAMIADKSHYHINVIDEGMGVPLQMQEKIFERFTRINTESTVTGLGLGLALSRDLVKRLEGTLTMHNIVPHGACFTIELPLFVE